MKKKKRASGLRPDPKPPKRTLLAWLRGRFFAGMVIAAPIAVTFWVLTFLIDFIDRSVKPLLPAVMRPETYTSYAIPGFGLIVLVIALTVLGAVATNLIGRSVISVGDRILLQLPVVKNVYSAIKQLVDVVATNNQDQFDEVVLVEFPKEGTWCVGFVSSKAKGQVRDLLDAEHIGVFVPTTPNPTSGFLMYVPSRSVRKLSMSVEEGAKMILSAGLVVPDSPVPAPVQKLEGESDT